MVKKLAERMPDIGRKMEYLLNTGGYLLRDWQGPWSPRAGCFMFTAAALRHALLMQAATA